VTDASPPRPGSTMKTVDKALTLLTLFSSDTPEYRLTDLARAAGMDKVTVMRMLASLARQGFVEQHAESRKYRLGTALLRLARIREATVPTLSVLKPILERLAEASGETAHAALVSGLGLTTVAIAEPNRVARVVLDQAQPLPLHATASGKAFLAFSSAERRAAALGTADLPVFTAATVVSHGALEAELAQIRATGLALAIGTYEDDVTGIAAPVFGWTGDLLGTIAAACMGSRMTQASQAAVATLVLRAAIDATRALGGEPAAALLARPGLPIPQTGAA